MSRIVIGSGNTDSDGLVTGDYTGSSKGVVKFVAYNKERTLSSEIYDVLDCLKYDTGILGTATDIYDARDSNSKFERKAEYSCLSQINTNSRANLYISGLNTSGTIELEIKSIASTVTPSNIGLNFYNGTNYGGFFGCHQMGMSASECEDWIKLKITYERTSFTVVNVDNPVRTVTRTTSAEINRVLLTIGANSSVSEFQIRNVKIY